MSVAARAEESPAPYGLPAIPPPTLFANDSVFN